MNLARMIGEMEQRLTRTLVIENRQIFRVRNAVIRHYTLKFHK